MRILELQLKNYRAFQNPVPFHFGERFSIIAGINGKGKTAILDGLALLFTRLPAARFAGSKRLPPDRSIGGLFRRELFGTKHEGQLRGNSAAIRFVLRERNAEITPTHLPPALKRAVRFAYADPARADDAAPLVVYYTTDRAGFRLPKKLPTEVPKGQAAAYKGALFNRTVNFRDFIGRYRNTAVIEGEEREEEPALSGCSAGDCYLGYGRALSRRLSKAACRRKPASPVSG